MAVTGDESETGSSGGELLGSDLHTSSSATLGLTLAHPARTPTEDASQKREHRLMKNREAARECRRKKKEYVKCLENRVAVLESQNQTLMEELKGLKDIYQQKL
ncbi:cyclic AMP-responsive element-binding protein 1-like [Nerophis ophidion]|uniref:cyclic AMP-responsive element-binding protein 1-like n=1 Tax=Nerophis ophidion TaxID=159077 RepID=UPI002AE056EC|nr:cyclic AMP-responsive element-binding protein 1-like [Nerophis ophidion]